MTAHRAQIMDFSSDLHPAKVTFKVLTCNTFASYSNLCRKSNVRPASRFGTIRVTPSPREGSSETIGPSRKGD